VVSMVLIDLLQKHLLGVLVRDVFNHHCGTFVLLGKDRIQVQFERVLRLRVTGSVVCRRELDGGVRASATSLLIELEG
jgi:hypothetical protein